MIEQAALFSRNRTLVGVLTEPSAPVEGAPAVLLLNSGIVHRVGPSRLYVKLARALAERGHVVVRFDGSGVGDSAVRRDDLPYEKSSVLETREVMDDLMRERGIRQFVLMGICSGAVTSFKAAFEDPRVVGAALMNPQGFDSSSQWNAYVKSRSWMREYIRKIFSPRCWLRALSGKSQYRRFFGLLFFRLKSRLNRGEEVSAVASNLGRELAALVDRSIHLLFLFTAGDESADYLSIIMGGRSAGPRRSHFVQEDTIIDSDHTFTCLGHQQQVIQAVETWMQKIGRERSVCKSGPTGRSAAEAIPARRDRRAGRLSGEASAKTEPPSALRLRLEESTTLSARGGQTHPDRSPDATSGVRNAG